MLTFIGIGPGDKELLTLKAVRIIREADAIAFADTGMGSSAVSAILDDLLRDKPLFPLEIPMKGKREDWLAAHVRAADRLLELLESHPSIAYPVLGDPGIYASSSYLKRLVEKKHPCSVVPGITTMCAAAAAAGIALCEQGESLTILDRFEPETSLPEGNAVIMKGGRKLAALKRAAAGREAWAVRNLGMENEWSGPLADIPEEDYSYFTTIIVKKQG
ncbi:MAG: precorrin-2 C(20)-methyltransferase [Clostridia bacterium]|nr:precorrin-2 C(20)-methyltransferase [Clostridia bacterium]